jgi:hypothetical protein
MSDKVHGFKVGQKRYDSETLIEVQMYGKLTHEDYEYATPLIESAIKSSSSVKLLADLRELDGWGMHAAWDDFKFGLEHRSDFKKIAMVGNKKWLEWSVKLGSHLVDSDVKFFENMNDAEDWIAG